MVTPLQHELDTATHLARAAGDATMAFYGTTRSETKAGGSPVTAADHAANDVIVAGLRDAFPDDAILSEESRDDRSRLDTRRVWIVDPLDGTKEFLARNGEFSIMIGLVVDGEPVLGAVYRPHATSSTGPRRGRARGSSGVGRRRSGWSRRRRRRGRSGWWLPVALGAAH